MQIKTSYVIECHASVSASTVLALSFGFDEHSTRAGFGGQGSDGGSKFAYESMKISYTESTASFILNFPCQRSYRRQMRLWRTGPLADPSRLGQAPVAERACCPNRNSACGEMLRQAQHDSFLENSSTSAASFRAKSRNLDLGNTP